MTIGKVAGQFHCFCMLTRSSLSLSKFFSKTLNIKPLGARVVVELDKASDKIGSLWVPESAKQQTNQGVVLAVGPGSVVKGKQLPMTVQVGQRVLLPSFGGQVVKIDKEEYTIIEEDNILAVFS
jgi:chaperonin GroES